jgi:protocatechuate 3,4-dioxygenase alpha subunit
VSTFPPTASQTVGPFFSPALLREDARRTTLIGPQTPGERIRIVGHVLDGDLQPIPDALVEIWQANAEGHYNHPSEEDAGLIDPTFTGFGRSGTDEDGRYWFETIKPGPVNFDDTRLQAPHISLTIFARGLLNHLMTRLYFESEPTNATDPILQRVPVERQQTLLARREQGDEHPTYRFDIILQGEGQTAFFNW